MEHHLLRTVTQPTTQRQALDKKGPCVTEAIYVAHVHLFPTPLDHLMDVTIAQLRPTLEPLLKRRAIALRNRS